MAAGAALFFIAWGVYANWQHGTHAIIQVAITQGAISFISTFLSAEWLRRLYYTFKRMDLSGAFTIPIGFVSINGTIFGAHHFAGTPEVLLTMLPGAAISIFFCSGLTVRLRHARIQAENSIREETA